MWGGVLKSNERIIKVDTRAGFYIVGEDDDFYQIEMTPGSINIEKRKTIFDFQIGENASITETATNEIVDKLADVSGDRNPIHLDEKYAEKGPFGKCIAHGLFCVGMISKLIGNILPGGGSILLEQRIRYCHPVYIGDQITATVKVASIDGIKRCMVLEHACINQDNVIVVDGMSKVKLF